jgi:hypothetical protein
MTTCATCRTGTCPTCAPEAGIADAGRSESWENHPGWDRPSAPATPDHGGARFVGDAAPVAGIPLSRIFDAACYVVTGIAMFVAAGHGIDQAWIPVLLGLAGVGYGLKILVTRSSYWVSSVVYVLPVLAVFWAIASIAN